MPSGAAAMAQPCWTSGATGVGNPSVSPWGETPGEGAIGRGPVASCGLTGSAGVRTGDAGGSGSMAAAVARVHAGEEMIRSRQPIIRERYTYVKRPWGQKNSPFKSKYMYLVEKMD
jgi:hypothetical protein